MHIKAFLTGIATQNGIAADTLQLPNCEIDPASIKVIMINEVVPRNPDDWFYSETHDPEKAVNMVAKARAKKNIIPSQPTGRIRGNEYYWDGLRVFPSYIMTGKNLAIEPGKCGTIAEDIRRMMDYLPNQ